MALNSVHMAADVYLVCLQHALSTEKEEVMGLLIGEVLILCSIFILLYLPYTYIFRAINSISAREVSYLEFILPNFRDYTNRCIMSLQILHRFPAIFNLRYCFYVLHLYKSI